MRRYLVVANQTLGETELVELIGKRTKAEPSEFFIIVPATPLIDFVLGAHAMPVMGGLPAVPDSPDRARALAQERLETALAQLQECGATVEGRVGDADPVRAVETALKGRQFDEIIVSTLAEPHLSLAASGPAPPPREQDGTARHPRRRRQARESLKTSSEPA